ncbi:sensor histidine kinase [Cryobacterium tepidiphilum]|uniref:sensor histidine kinase n=1 Tax=Cryobacterium tepidiphilum TaxID=2486026 RepID=UPI0011CDB13A|nr:ATP-binding protein [Cryobacterium tepidiphilum]
MPASTGRIDRDRDNEVDRLTRLIYLVLGVSAVFFGALSLRPLLEQAPGADFPLVAACWLLAFGVPVAMGALSLWAPLRVLRLLAVIEGVVFVLAIAEWLLFRDGRLPEGNDIPWVITFTAIPAVCVATVARARVAWGYVILVSGLSGWVRAWSSSGVEVRLIGAKDSLYTLLLISVFVGLTIAVRRIATRVAAAAEADRAAYSESAARISQKHERLTVDALVHDSVLSVLLMAGRGSVDIAHLSAYARQTLGRITGLNAPPPANLVPASVLGDRLRTLTAELAPGTAFASNLGARPVPALVVDALVLAAGEALRNSLRHAGLASSAPARPVSRSVDVHDDHGTVVVRVRDDGIGFDAADVPADRLGIARSIVARMSAFVGGSARVFSRPGAGTEVTLAWTPDRPAAGGDAPASFSAMFSMLAPVVRVIIVLFVVVHGVLAFTGPGAASWFPLELLAFLAVSAAAVLCTRAAVNPLPAAQTLGTVALLAAAEILMFFEVTPQDTAAFAHWHLGAITLVLLVLAMRGRNRIAWSCYGGLFAATVAWAVVNGLPAAGGVGLVIRHAGTLLAGTLWVFAARRSMATLTELNRQRTVRDAAELAETTAIQERHAQLARLSTLARPMLERLADAHPLSADDQAECLQVEATLRDAIRARSLFVEPVISAAKAARARGVDVTLLDDSADRPPGDMAPVTAAVAGELDAAASGRVTARVLPAGRDALATIVVDSDRHRIVTVTADGMLG